MKKALCVIIMYYSLRGLPCALWIFHVSIALKNHFSALQPKQLTTEVPANMSVRATLLKSKVISCRKMNFPASHPLPHISSVLKF